MIALEQVTKKYGSFTAVDRIDLTVPRRTLFALLGPNGAGKTTVVRMIAGILQPTAGCVRIAGIDVQADPEGAKRHLGFIPDRPDAVRQGRTALRRRALRAGRPPGRQPDW